jgi:ribosomal protein S12 methylthiotransferase accessory factor
MTLQLRLPSEFPEKYRESILHAMDSCAVKKHIIESPEFEVVLL